MKSKGRAVEAATRKKGTLKALLLAAGAAAAIALTVNEFPALRRELKIMRM